MGHGPGVPHPAYLVAGFCMAIVCGLVAQSRVNRWLKAVGHSPMPTNYVEKLLWKKQLRRELPIEVRRWVQRWQVAALAIVVIGALLSGWKH